MNRVRSEHFSDDLFMYLIKSGFPPRCLIRLRWFGLKNHLFRFTRVGIRVV